MIKFNKVYTSNKYKEFNEIPVHYCRKCLGLNIKNEDELDFCECGSMEIGIVPFANWEKLFYQEYGVPYVSISNEVFKEMKDAAK